MAAGVDALVGVVKGGLNGVERRLVGRLVVGERDEVRGHFAGQLAGSMGAHPIGHHEQMAAPQPFVLFGSYDDDERILVVRAAQSYVAGGGVFEGVLPI